MCPHIKLHVMYKYNMYVISRPISLMVWAKGKSNINQKKKAEPAKAIIIFVS
jgi:hypothetical protein